MESRFKLIFLVAVLFMTGLPVMGILRGTDPPPAAPDRNLQPLPFDSFNSSSDHAPQESRMSEEEEMVEIPAGEFIEKGDIMKNLLMCHIWTLTGLTGMK